jgi:hypothetical protein
MEKKEETSTKEDYLILLDVNGLLGTKTKDTFKLHSGAKSFISFCYDIARVGIFSSMYRKNIFKVLDDILTEEQKHDMYVIFDRDSCVSDPAAENPWDTIKNLNLIRGTCSKFKKIILCDDTESKVRFNDDNEVIVSTDYEYIKKELVSRLHI